MSEHRSDSPEAPKASAEGAARAGAHIPALMPSRSVLEAALVYAAAGLFVLPVAPGTKNPGSVVGPGWQHRSSRDREQLFTWFATGAAGIAIHLGASGLIAFDVDQPDGLSDPLRSLLLSSEGPFQATRKDCPIRGHYLFSVPEGSRLGNSVGDLGKGWGDVRAGNAVIMVSPSKHPSPEGLYRWVRSGAPQELPEWLLQRLQITSSAPRPTLILSQTLALVVEHREAWWPELLDRRINDVVFVEGSRHATCVALLVTCLQDAVVGAYPAQVAIDRVLDVFATAKPQDQHALAAEFVSIVKWAVGAVAALSDDERSSHRDLLEILRWVMSDSGRAAVQRLTGGCGDE